MDLLHVPMIYNNVFKVLNKTAEPEVVKNKEIHVFLKQVTLMVVIVKKRNYNRCPHLFN